MRVLIIGSGYVGTLLAAQLRQLPDCQVWTLRRNPPAGHDHDLAGDITHAARFTLPPNLTHVVFCAGLKGASEEEYKRLFIDGVANVLTALQEHPLERFIFTSTTGVYAEEDGNWVDETHPVQARRISTAYYIEAEQAVLNIKCTSVIARLSGIYGPGRTRMITAALQERSAAEPTQIRPHYVNHIHRHDAAAALAHLLTINNPTLIYNVTDTLPVEREILLAWIANHSTSHEPTQPLHPIRRSGSGNKRVSGRRLLESGFKHCYPTYREGYAELIAKPEGIGST